MVETDIQIDHDDASGEAFYIKRWAEFCSTEQTFVRGLEKTATTSKDDFPEGRGMEGIGKEEWCFRRQTGAKN